MKTTKINQQELIEMLKSIDHSQPVTLIVETEKKINGLNLIKANHFNCMIGVSFQNSMNNALKKKGEESNYVCHNRKWGSRIPKTPLVSHNSKTYLECRILKEFGHVLRDMSGKIMNFKDKPTSELVKLRDFDVKNIRQINLMSQKFEIIN